MRWIALGCLCAVLSAACLPALAQPAGAQPAGAQPAPVPNPAHAAALAPALAKPEGPGAGPARPQTARRLVRAWDFEDRVSRVEPVPLGWYRAQDNPPQRERLGYPAWNVPGLTSDRAFSGQRSVRLPTQGGNASMMMSAGLVPVLPEGDYAVLARVMTEGLVYARARISMRFLDAALTPIPGAESASKPVRSEGEWEISEASLRGVASAAWLQIELELLQPTALGVNTALEDAREDFRGSAYFDDLIIYQVPRVVLTCPTPGAIVIEPDTPRLDAMIRDLTGEALRMDLEVFDLNGEVVASATMPAPPSGRHAEWRPALPAFGWYRATVHITGPSGPVGARHADFIWAPASTAPDPNEYDAFGLVAQDVREAQLSALPDLLRHSNSGSVWLPVWPPKGETSQTFSVSAQRLAEELLDKGVDVTFALSHIPEAVAHQAKTDPSDAIGLFLAPDDPWLRLLSRTLTSFGERVHQWQFGPVGIDSKATAADVAIVREKLQRLIPRPGITLPTSLPRTEQAASSGADALVELWPLSIPGEGLPPLAQSGDRSAQPRTLLIQTFDDVVFGRRATAVDLGRRAVEAWAAGYKRLALMSPWTTHQDEPGALLPSVELAAWRTLSSRMAGSTIVATLPVAEGVRLLVAQTPRGGMLIGWNQSADPEKAVVSGLFAEGPITAVDLFGNPVKVERETGSGFTVRLEESPVFIEGVDLPLTRFRAAMRVEPGFLPARAQKQSIEVVVENPWPQGITGRLRLDAPEHWNIAPRVLGFTVPAGGSARLPTELSFTLGEEAGVRRINAQVELYADRGYPIVSVPLMVEIGLPTVDLLPSYRYEPSPDGSRLDVVVTAVVTNISERVLTVEAFAQAPGYRAFDAPVSELQPGHSVTRRFRFENGAATLRGKSVRVGIKEQAGTGRLNKTMSID